MPGLPLQGAEKCEWWSLPRGLGHGLFSQGVRGTWGLMNAALRTRWCWLSRTELWRPWQGLPLDIEQLSVDIFEAATTVTLRSGQETDFWEDTWIQGRRLKDIAPTVYAARSLGGGLLSFRWRMD